MLPNLSKTANSVARAFRLALVRPGRRGCRHFLLPMAALCFSAGALLHSQPAGKAEAATEVYVVPFSHLDFFWGGTREECLARGNRIIAKAIQIANEHPEFRFLIEDEDFVANYAETHPGSPELESLKALVKQGRIEIAPKWAAIFQNLPDGEILARNLVYGKRYARNVFGVDPQVAHMGDIPGFTPQFPQMLAKTGIPFMVMTRMGPADTSLFYWKAPDGSKTLVWSDLRGYGWGSHLGLQNELTPARRAQIEKELAQVRATTSGPIFMTWGSDLWAPAPKLVENVNLLNQEIPSSRFHLATPTEFFQRAIKTPGLPELAGEIPSSWPNVVSSLPHMWPLVAPAAHTLLAAEKFAAINYALGYAGYPQRDFEFLWRKLIESTDHNHDGQGGAAGDERKIEYSRMSIMHGGEILRDMLRNIAERVQIPFPKSFPLVVFNPLGWQRDDVVDAHVTLYGDVAPRDIEEYKKAIRIVDEKGQAVPFHIEEYSENISRALRLVFLARGVPSLGYKTYYIEPAQAPENLSPAAQVTLDEQNDIREPRRPLGSDVMENEFYRVTVDKATGRVALFDKDLNREVSKGMEVVAVEERGGNYVAVEPPSGRTIYNSIDRVSLMENNPVRTVLQISGRIADIPIVQRWSLYRGAKRVDLENTIEWKGPRYVRLQQVFPLEEANAEIHYGVPFGENNAANLIPHSGPHMPDELTSEEWLEARHIQDWIFAGSGQWGLTIASSDQLMKLGGGAIRSEMLRGTRFTSVRVVRGSEVTSLHYPPPGLYHFRYSLSSGHGDWKTLKSYQAGMNLTQPLIAVSVVDDISRKSLPPTRSFCSLEGDNLVISALKKSDAGPSLILRFFEIQGKQAETPVTFLNRKRSFEEVNLLEENPGRQGQVARVAPYEIKTVKLPLER